MYRFSQIAIDAVDKFLALGNSLSEAIFDDGSQSAGMDLTRPPLAGFENGNQLWLQLSKHHLPSFMTSYIHIASQAHEEMVKLADKQIRTSQQLIALSLDGVAVDGQAGREDRWPKSCPPN